MSPTDALPESRRERLFHLTRQHSEQTIREEQKKMRRSEEQRTTRRASIREVRERYAQLCARI